MPAKGPRRELSGPWRLSHSSMKFRTLFAAAAAVLALTMGCSTLDEKQRAWIFQPSDRSWGGSAEMARDMDDAWIAFDSKVTGQPVKLHGLWLPAATRAADGPVLLYLHGARWN